MLDAGTGSRQSWMGMDELLTKLLEQAPSAGVVVVTVVIFIKYLTRRDAQHDAVLRDITGRYTKEIDDLATRQFDALQRNTDAFTAFKVQLAKRKCLLNGAGCDRGPGEHVSG